MFINNLFEEITDILNHDNLVNDSATISQQGEQFLDAIETASENERVGDIISAVEKTGLTKDSIIISFEKLDMCSSLEKN